MREMWFWNVLTWNVTTVLTMQVAMITMLGMRLPGVPHPLLFSTFKDQRVGNRPVHWLLNRIQLTGIGLPQRTRGAMQAFQTSSWSIVISPQVFECFLVAWRHLGLVQRQTTTWKCWYDRTARLVMHSKTCFASFIKIHGCQLHLQLCFPASHSSAMNLYYLQYARLNHLHSTAHGAT